MTTVIKRYPTIKIDMVSEDSEYSLSFDTSKTKGKADITEGLISLSVQNDQNTDSPVFSLVLVGSEKWDTLLDANDLISIQIIPDKQSKEPVNPYVMVGLINSVHPEGEFTRGSMMYRISGQAMSKALIKFKVGVIQEVATIIPDIGWLPDSGDNGLNFSGNTAAGIAQELFDRFIVKYAKYRFKEKTLQDYLIASFTSWEDESLADVTPFINYEGSMRQFFEDISAKPFNEFFFEFTNKGQCAAIMRPTPFDPDKWYELPTYQFTSDSVVEESLERSDNEMYSVFVVQAPNIVDFNSMDLGVYPKFHPSLIEKYGYTRLDVQNRYLLASDVITSADTAEATTDENGIPIIQPTFDELVQYLNENNYDSEYARTNRSFVVSQIATNFPGLAAEMVDKIADSLTAGEFTAEEYQVILDSTKTPEQQAERNKERGVANRKLERYTQRIFNWYCENANFYGGDIRIIGNPNYRVGSRVFYDDAGTGTVWEYYVEAVSHEYSYTNGYTTVLGLTRGLPDSGSKRFSNLWGQSEDFKGGYLGEKSLADLLATANSSSAGTDSDNFGGNYSGADGGATAMTALQIAMEQKKPEKDSIYVLGGGRNGSFPFNTSPIKVDCSSFVWWCFYGAGVSLKGGKTGMTTDTIAADTQLQTVSAHGSSKDAAMSKLMKGDIVFFDTYKKDGHVGIYAGGGQFVGCQGSSNYDTSGGIEVANMSSGYWWNVFKGHVKRLP